MATIKTTGKKSPPPKPQLHVKTITISQVEHDILDRLSQDATDFLGRRVGHSALLRALIRQIVRQGPPAADALFLLVEKEMNAGVLWGKKR